MAERTRVCQRLRWHLRDSVWSTTSTSARSDQARVRARLRRRLQRSEGGRRAAIALLLLADIGRLTRQIRERQRELRRLVVAYAPGCSSRAARVR